MKIRIIASSPVDGQEELNSYIGREYETVELKKHYDKDTVKEMNELGEVAVYLEENDKWLSIINKNEYEVL